MKIRITSPTGCVTTAEIAKPEKKLQDWQLGGYVRQDLRKRNIEFRKFVIIK